jgi:hypothetical protein
MTRTRTHAHEQAAAPVLPEPEPAQPNGAAEIIPPPHAGDDLNEFSRFVVSDAVVPQQGEIITCSVGPPNKLYFFRVHPDPKLQCTLHTLEIEVENRKRVYLVSGALVALPEFEGRTKAKLTVPWINHHGGLGVWLISAQHDQNSWCARR